MVGLERKIYKVFVLTIFACADLSHEYHRTSQKWTVCWVSNRQYPYSWRNNPFLDKRTHSTLHLARIRRMYASTTILSFDRFNIIDRTKTMTSRLCCLHSQILQVTTTFGFLTTSAWLLQRRQISLNCLVQRLCFLLHQTRKNDFWQNSKTTKL